MCSVFSGPVTNMSLILPTLGVLWWLVGHEPTEKRTQTGRQALEVHDVELELKSVRCFGCMESVSVNQAECTTCLTNTEAAATDLWIRILTASILSKLTL